MSNSNALILLVLVVGGVFFMSQGEMFFGSLFFIALLLVLVTNVSGKSGASHGGGHHAPAGYGGYPYGPIVMQGGGGHGGGKAESDISMHIEPDWDPQTGMEKMGINFAKFINKIGQGVNAIFSSRKH